MGRFLKTAAILIAMLAFALGIAGCGVIDDLETAFENADEARAQNEHVEASPSVISEAEEYSTKDEVALYIHSFGHLPSNYVSKTKAHRAGWVNTEGNLWDVLPGTSIGGSDFYDDDNQLPYESGRRWKECDVNYEGGYRGPERLVYSNDGLIYYTGDHYKTFERLY